MSIENMDASELFKTFHNEKSTMTKSMVDFCSDVEKKFQNKGYISDKQKQAIINIILGNREFVETVEDGIDLLGEI